jgi:carbonic anhydrase
MKALLAEAPANPHLRRWLEFGRPSIDRLREPTPDTTPRPDYDRLSMANATRQIETLKTYPVVRAKLEKGELNLHAWWFDVMMGQVLVFTPREGRYVGVEQAAGSGGPLFSTAS